MVGVTGLTELSSSDELVQLAAEKLDSVYGDMFMGGLDNPEGIKFQLPLLIDFEFSLTVIPVKEGVAKSIKALNHEEHEGHEGKEKLFFVLFVVPFFSGLFATPFFVWGLI